MIPLGELIEATSARVLHRKPRFVSPALRMIHVRHRPAIASSRCADSIATVTITWTTP